MTGQDVAGIYFTGGGALDGGIILCVDLPDRYTGSGTHYRRTAQLRTVTPNSTLMIRDQDRNAVTRQATKGRVGAVNLAVYQWAGLQRTTA